MKKLVQNLRRMGAIERSFLLGLALPFGLILLSLKAVRLATTIEIPSFFAGLDMASAEILMVTGLTLAGLGALRAAGDERRRLFLLAIMQLIASVIFITEASAHRFFVMTGTPIDAHLILFFIERAGGLIDVIASEMSAAVVVGLPLFSSLLLALPWLVRRRIVAEADAAHPPSDTTGGGRGMLGVGLALTVAAVFAPFSVDFMGHSRPAVVNIAETLLTHPDAMSDEVARVELPGRDAYLEPRSHQADEQEHTPPNLAIIILESTRSSATTLHNRELETTPYLAQLAESSVVAERAYAVMPHTTKALVAILCGFEPQLSMSLVETEPGSLPVKCLPELLEAQQYRTAFFQSAHPTFEDRNVLVDNMGFEFFISPLDTDLSKYEEVNYLGWEDDVMLEPNERWLRARQDEPFFATYLTLVPHHDYDVPGGAEVIGGDDDYSRYLNGVHYVDRFVRSIFAQYKEAGLYEETLFVVLADHGEGFLEHGRSQHDNVIYQEGIHIPFLIHDPRDRRPRRLQHNITQLDLLPTVVSLLGFELVGDDYSGEHLLEVDGERPIRAHCWYEKHCMAQIRGAEKYIYHAWTRPEQFFDLAEDPGEEHDLAGQREDLDARRADLAAWRTRINSIYHAHEALR